MLVFLKFSLYVEIVPIWNLDKNEISLRKCVDLSCAFFVVVTIRSVWKESESWFEEAL